MTAVTTTQNGVAKSSQFSFSPEQIELIKRQVAPKATNDELAIFLHVAKRSGLDPLAKQIYCIHRMVWNPETRQKDPKMTIQTGIDGFRVIAERSGVYGGQSKPVFTYDETGHLDSVEITVYKFRGDTRYEAAVAIAFWDEYVQTDKDGKPTQMWSSKSHVMLSKVAEALALRKAFPQDLSGIYVEEEMMQADNTVNIKAEEVEPITIDGYDKADPKPASEDVIKKYSDLWQDYRELVGENAAAPYHHDEWDQRRIKNNYVYAFATRAMQERIDEFVRKAAEEEAAKLPTMNQKRSTKTTK